MRLYYYFNNVTTTTALNFTAEALVGVGVWGVRGPTLKTVQHYYSTEGTLRMMMMMLDRAYRDTMPCTSLLSSY